MAKIEERPATETLIGALHALDVHFLGGGTTAAALPPTQLLVGLAEHEDARVRLAIIPLLLCRPEFATSVPEALRSLSPAGRTTLTFFYTAARLLQQTYRDELQRWLPGIEPLPDLVGEQLNLSPKETPDEQLASLAEQHKLATGIAANWRGTYEHAARRLLKRLEVEAQWAMTFPR